MKTKKALARRAIISCVYFLISMVLATLALAPSPVVNKFHYNAETGAGLVMLVAAFLYFIHFLYGAIYYREKYNEIIEKFAYGDYGDVGSIFDWSFLRAYIAMFLVLIGFAMAGYTTNTFQTIYVVWILLNMYLSAKTRTSNLFVKDSVTIDAPLLMSWKKTDDSGHLYETIYFLRPVLEDAALWRQKIVKAYIAAEAQLFSIKTRVEMDDLKRKQLATEETIKLAAALKIPHTS